MRPMGHTSRTPARGRVRSRVSPWQRCHDLPVRSIQAREPVAGRGRGRRDVPRAALRSLSLDRLNAERGLHRVGIRGTRLTDRPRPALLASG